MKNVVFIALLAGTIGFGCANTQKSNSVETQHEVVDLSPESAATIEGVLSQASESVEKEVVVKGMVTHVCKHSGKRCFLTDSDGKTSIRVEAMGNINGFNTELDGSQIVVKGVLKEDRMEAEFIKEWETKTLAEKEKSEKEDDLCEAELSNIQHMKDWMAANNKDFYSVFYIEGVDYEIVD